MVVLAIVYFQAMFMSHLFFHLATSSDLGLKRKLLKMSHYFMPLDHYPSYEYAYSYLDKGAELHDEKLLAQGIEWFNASLFINPFYYYSHYYLGKAYYFYHFPSGDFFADTFTSLKKAALINDHDPDIVVDLSKIVLSMWPHLQDRDRTLCLDLLKKNIGKLKDRDFKNIIVSWHRYSKDADVLRMMLQDKASLHGKAAGVLAEVGGPLPLRWELLAGYERYLFEVVRNRMKSLSFAENASEIEFVKLLEQLEKIKGYGRMVPGKWVPGPEFYALVSDLMLKRITAFLEGQKKPLGSRPRTKLFGMAMRYIKRLEHYKNLEALRRLFTEYSYFAPNDIEALYIKSLMEYKQGNYSSLISSIEEFRTRASLIGKQHKQEYRDILLLLADSLESSKLLSVANRTDREILRIFPDEPGIVWRLMKVQRILGIQEEEAILDKNLVQTINDSRFFLLDNKPIYRDVMFLDKPELSLSRSGNRTRGSDGNALVRVFVNESIAVEFYLKDMKAPLIYSMPGKEYSSVDVRVEFLVFNDSTVI